MRSLQWESVPYFRRNSIPDAVTVKQAFYLLKLMSSQRNLPEFEDLGFSVFSQNDEDGLVLAIFSQIGFKTRTSIEIGCNIDNTSVGIPEGNSINLIVNFGFRGLIIDRDEMVINPLVHFFAENISTRQFHNPNNQLFDRGYFSPVIINETMTSENADQVIVDAGFEGEIDLLSIDIDGDDIKLFDSLTSVSPRVIIIEINNRVPFEERKVNGEMPQSKKLEQKDARYALGSSFTEVIKEVEKRNYTFIGMNNSLLNAFFVRTDEIAQLSFEPTHVSSILNHRNRAPESKTISSPNF